MDSFEIQIDLKIVTPSESEPGKFFILLDDDGSIPSINLSNQSGIDFQIADKLNEYLYTQELNIAMSTKQISNILQVDNKLILSYNFICTSLSSKKGSYIIFSKNSLKLAELSKKEN